MLVIAILTFRIKNNHPARLCKVIKLKKINITDNKTQNSKLTNLAIPHTTNVI
jgi:hypothetical protein